MNAKFVTTGNWTEEMDSLLRELVARKASKKEVMLAFPSKNYNSLYLRMYRIKAEAEHLPIPTQRGTVRANLRKFRPEEKERNCLTCGVKFMSSGPGNRLCMNHRRENDDGTFTVKTR